MSTHPVGRPRKHANNAAMHRASRERLAAKREQLAADFAALQAAYAKAQELKVYHRSQRDDWGTPREVFAPLNAEFGFTLDAAASASNALCEQYYTILDNALVQPWTGIVFLNPPYGHGVQAWIRKAWESAQEGATVVCLVKATPDTVWWHTYTQYAEVRLLKGRIKFVGAEHAAPFPSALVIFRPPIQRTTPC